MDKGALERVTCAIDGYKEESIRLQTELCKIPALGPENGGDGEEKKAALLGQYLREVGFGNIERYDAPDDRVPCGYRPNIVATLPGKTPSAAMGM